MTVKAAKANAEEPEARPSRPSVRLTAFMAPTITRTAKITQPDFAELQPERVVPRERKMRVHSQPFDGNDGEGKCHHELAGDFGPFVEPQAALARHLQPVVQETDKGGATNGEHPDQAAGGKGG